MLWLIIGLLAQASPTTICADLASRLERQDAKTDEIVAFIDRDDRNYSDAVLECLCVVGVPPDVAAAAHRRVLRDTVPINASRWEIFEADAPNFQVSSLLGRRLEARAGRAKAFIVLPTQLDAPRWFDVGRMIDRFRDFEVSGTALQSQEDLDLHFGIRLPRGSLQQLSSNGTLSTFNLSALSGTYDRALWLDVAPSADGGTRLSWSFVDVSGMVPTRDRPNVVLNQDQVVLDILPGHRISDCDAPRLATRQRWNGRLQWPASRVVVTSIGGAMMVGFGAAALNEFAGWQRAAPDDPSNAGRQTRNIAFGSVFLGGAVTAAIGLAIPGPIWRP